MEDLTAVLERAGRPNSEEDDYMTMMAVASIAVHSPDRDKSFAVQFRLDALARFIRETGARGWSLAVDSPEGGTMTHRALIHAAAIEPVLIADEEVYFDPESLRARALELVDPEGAA